MESCLAKVLSKIDKRTKYGVYGWIRQAEEELNLDAVPNGICSIIILYLRMDDIFSIIGEGIKVTKNGKLLTKLEERAKDRACYGEIEIDSISNGIYQWDLNIYDLSGWVSFGISSFVASDEFGVSWLAKTGGYYYGIYVDVKKRNFDIADTIDYDLHVNNIDYISILGAVVSIYFNANKGELRYSINGSQPQIAHCDIEKGMDIKYRLIVVLSHKDDCVELTNFVKEEIE